MIFPPRLSVVMAFVFSNCLVFAQTGPGGVGNAVSNVLWLKGDAGTSTTVAGSSVSAWNDQSGNGIDVSQPLVAQQPLFQPSIINGFPGIQFDNNSTPGQNDKLIGADSPLLDNTTGYSFFTVSRPQTLGTNSIVSKRIDVGVHQSFMLFYYTGSKFHVDIQTNNDRFASPATFSNNTSYLIDVIYDGTLPAASRSKIYIGENLNITSGETSSLVADNASPLLIGSTHLTDERPFAGYISEVIIYREALNKASRIIVNNHLSAKYDLPLTLNDKYAGDTPANGNYDLDVAGIGTDTIQPSGTAGSNSAFASFAGKGLGIAQVSGFQAGDYVLAGHRTAVNSAINTDITGLTGPAPCRWERIWYVDVTNNGPSTVVNIDFDMSDGGVSPVPGFASQYFLLYRAAQTGAWTPLTPASGISGDKVLFSNFTIQDDGYYTIGSINCYASPLPVELISFTAEKQNRETLLSWATASEYNSDYFTVEHSTDGLTWNETDEVAAAGNSTSLLEYTSVHSSPSAGVNYYRLVQADQDGASVTSDIRTVKFDQEQEMLVFPNPATDEVTITWKDAKIHKLELTDLTGKILLSFESEGSITISLLNFAAGHYYLKTENGETLPLVKL